MWAYLVADDSLLAYRLAATWNSEKSAVGCDVHALFKNSWVDPAYSCANMSNTVTMAYYGIPGFSTLNWDNLRRPYYTLYIYSYSWAWNMLECWRKLSGLSGISWCVVLTLAILFWPWMLKHPEQVMEDISKKPARRDILHQQSSVYQRVAMQLHGPQERLPFQLRRVELRSAQNILWHS